MTIYILMQHLQSNNGSSNLPLKAFSKIETAGSFLENYNSNLRLFEGLKLAYERLLNDCKIRNEENPEINQALEKEKERLIKVLELDSFLEAHGISIEDQLPHYYVVNLDLE